MPYKNKGKWKETTIGEICTVIAGQSPKSQYYNTTKQGIPFYQGKKEFTEKYIGQPNIWTTRITKEALAGDILMSVRAPVGPINYATQRCCIGRGLAAIRKTDVIDKNFLFYYLLSIQKVISGHNGAVFDSISRTEIENLKIKLPPLPEQQRIVEILDKAFANIDKAKENVTKNLNNAKELFENYLTFKLSKQEKWDKKRLDEVAIDFGRGRSRHRPRNDKNLYGGKYPFIQTGDIRNANHFITKYSQTYNEIGLAQSKLWPKGTLCITIAANIAETGILTFDACFPDSVIGGVFDKEKINIDYVEYLLHSFKAILQAEGKGSAQDNINLGTFEKYKFPFPDKITQDKIVLVLNEMRENITKLEQIYEQKIKDLDELKQSILQKAFNGEL